MLNLKEIEEGIKGLSTKIDFYCKMQKEALKLGIEDLIDFENYLK